MQPIHEKKISQSFEEAESVSLEEELSENKSQSNVYMIEDQLDTLESRIDLIKKSLEKNSIKIKHQNYEDKNTQTNQQTLQSDINISFGLPKQGTYSEAHSLQNTDNNHYDNLDHYKQNIFKSQIFKQICKLYYKIYKC